VKRRGGYNRRERSVEWQDERSEQRQNGNSPRNNERIRGERKIGAESHVRVYERLRWNPPVPSADPMPIPNCSYCGKPIRDITTAIDDKTTGAPAHFDCIIRRLMETEDIEKVENLEKGDVIAYIGGGRFGVVRFGEGPDKPAFTILKIFEWEDKDNRAEWRTKISDQYSLT
jgi:hypothetical protein